MKKTAICIIAVSLVVLISGCTSNGLSKNNGNDDQANSYVNSISQNMDSSNDSYETSARVYPGEDGYDELKDYYPFKTYSIDQLSSEEYLSSIFVERNGQCTELVELPYSHTIQADYHFFNNGYKKLYPIDPANGDQLLTTINDDAKCVEVEEIGYFGGPSDIDFYEPFEINGIEVAINGDKDKTVESLLLPFGIKVINLTGTNSNYYDLPKLSACFYSNEPSTFKIGQYTGTKWNEQTVEIDNPCYIANELNSSSSKSEWKSLPVEKTKSGYFIIDYSSLVPGKYVLSSGNVSTMIEII